MFTDRVCFGSISRHRVGPQVRLVPCKSANTGGRRPIGRHRRLGLNWKTARTLKQVISNFCYLRAHANGHRRENDHLAGRLSLAGPATSVFVHLASADAAANA